MTILVIRVKLRVAGTVMRLPSNPRLVLYLTSSGCAATITPTMGEAEKQFSLSCAASVNRLCFFVLIIAASVAQGVGQVTTNRTYSFDLLQQSAVPAGLIPFYAQDLVVAKNEPATNPSATNMSFYAGQVKEQFLQKHGHSPTNELETAVSVVDWVSDHLRHPYFWPEDPALPRFYKINDGPKYATLGFDPVQILNYATSNDLKDGTTWPGVLCTYQNAAAAGILNYLGLHARLCNAEAHTSLEYFSFVEHRWLWMDSTFNEHYVQVKPDGSELLLGVRELNALTLSGQTAGIRAVKHGRPSATHYKQNVFLGVHPHGCRYYAPITYMNFFHGGSVGLHRFHDFVCVPPWPKEFVPLPGEVPDPGTDSSAGGYFWWPRVPSPAALDYPIDSLVIAGAPAWDGKALKIQVQSYLPYTTAFELYDAKNGWVKSESIAKPSNGPLTAQPVSLDFGSGLRKLRARDGRGNLTQEVILKLY